MRRHLAYGTVLATLLVMTACGSDNGSPSASSTNNSTDGTTGIDGSGVTVPDSGSAAGSTTTAKGASGSSTSASGSTGAGTTVAGTSGTATTVAGSPSNTSASSGATTVPPATNAVPQDVADLVLRSDGLGSIRFGVSSDVAVAAISAVLGTPSSDAKAEYPLPAGDGTFKSQTPGEDGAPPEDDLGFVKPFGREVCWVNGLCIESGGDAAGTYSFVGWYYAAADDDHLATADGLDTGSRWSDFTSVMTVDPGGCYSIGHGSSAGISLTLQSDGTPFSDFAANGDPIEATPDPADVTVVQMQAGDQVIFLIGDC
jgi:hypothetical protein